MNEALLTEQIQKAITEQVDLLFEPPKTEEQLAVYWQLVMGAAASVTAQIKTVSGVLRLK